MLMYYRYLFLFLFFLGGVQATQAETAPQYVVEVDTLVPSPPAQPRCLDIIDYLPIYCYYLKEHCQENESDQERKQCGDLALRDDLMSALIYPKAAKEKSLEATVYIRYTVTVEGKMENIELVKLVGEEKMGFEEAALNAVRTVAKTAKWEAAQEFGKKVSMRMVVPIRFKSEKD